RDAKRRRARRGPLLRLCRRICRRTRAHACDTASVDIFSARFGDGRGNFSRRFRIMIFLLSPAIRRWLAVLLIFLSGAVVGTFGTVKVVQWKVEQFTKNGPEGVRKYVLWRLGRELKLTDAQKRSLDPLVAHAQEELKAFRRLHKEEP